MSTQVDQPNRLGLLHNKQFLSLFGGNLALFFGFSATILVRSLITWELTADEMSLAYINMVTATGIFCVSFFSGVIIDRLERKKLLLIAHSIIFISEFCSFLLYASGHLTFEILLLLTVSLSVTFPFVMPTRTTMLVPAVGKSGVAKATALMSSGVSLARMISPAIAGFLAEAVNLTAAYLFLVSLYATSLLCVISLKPNYPDKTVRRSFLAELNIGFSYIYRNKPLASCLLFGMIPMLVVVPLQNLLVIFAEKVWQAGGSGLGLLMTMMGLGGLLGSLFAARLKARSLVRSLFTATLLLSVFLMLFSYAPNIWVAAIVMLGIYSCSVMTQTLIHTAIQLMTDDHVRGRVTTISLMSFSLAPLGTIPIAYLSKQYDAPWAITLGAMFVLLCTLGVWFYLPAFKAVDAATQHYRR